MIAVAVVLAQATDPTSLANPSTWAQFGPFAIVFVVMTGIIGWLLKDRATTRTDHVAQVAAHQADVKGYRDQLAAERREKNELYDRIIAYGKDLGPIVERNTQIQERTARALERVEART